MASPGNRHCANCIGTLSFPYDGLAASACVRRRNDVTMTSHWFIIRIDIILSAHLTCKYFVFVLYWDSTVWSFVDYVQTFSATRLYEVWFCFFTFICNWRTRGHSFELFLPDSRVNCTPTFFRCSYAENLELATQSADHLSLFISRLVRVNLNLNQFLIGKM